MASKKTGMTVDEMVEKAAKLQRQRGYRREYNKGTYITDKEVVVIGGANYIRYKAGGVEKMRIARDGESIDGLKITELS